MKKKNTKKSEYERYAKAMHSDLMMPLSMKDYFKARSKSKKMAKGHEWLLRNW